MLKVQVELFEFKTRSTSYYQELQKNIKLDNLQNSVEWLRKECIRLATHIERLTQHNKALSSQYKEASTEVKVWHDQAVKAKAYNVILKETIMKLKSPAQLEKYERNGYQKGQQES